MPRGIRKSNRASVRLRFLPDRLVLEVEDEAWASGSSGTHGHGPGVDAGAGRDGERAAGFLERSGGGALVRLTVPAAAGGGACLKA